MPPAFMRTNTHRCFSRYKNARTCSLAAGWIPTTSSRAQHRAKSAWFDPAQVCSHTFRGTSTTTYLENGGQLERPNILPATTTKLDDRRN